MKPSLLRYSAWISLVLLALVSCRSSKVIISGEKAEAIYQSMISGSFEKQAFKARMSYKEKELSGRMIIKNAGEGKYKIAFFSELGLTYLEGTLESSSKSKKFIVNNIAPVLDNKLILKNFEKALQIVVSGKSQPLLPSSPLPSHPAPPPPHLPVIPAKAGTPPPPSSLTVKLHNGFLLELEIQE